MGGAPLSAIVNTEQGVLVGDTTGRVTLLADDIRTRARTTSAHDARVVAMASNGTLLASIDAQGGVRVCSAGGQRLVIM